MDFDQTVKFLTFGIKRKASSFSQNQGENTAAGHESEECISELCNIAGELLSKNHDDLKSTDQSDQFDVNIDSRYVVFHY